MLSWRSWKCVRLSVLGFFLCSAFLAAQEGSLGSMPSQTMHSAPSAMIDGAQHPELIKDATAYRLAFAVLGLTANASANEQTAQILRLQDAGLSDNDLNAALLVLNSFKSQYITLIQTFNNSAHATIESGGTPDLQSFDVTRDALVQATRDELKQVLSLRGMAAFNSFIQREKTRMRVPASAQ